MSAQTASNILPFVPTVHRNADIVDELMILPLLSPAEYSQRVRAIADDAIAEIVRLRGGSVPGAVDWDRQLVVDREGKPWRPGHMQWLVLAKLLRSTGKLVSYESLFAELYGDRIDGGPECAENNIKVMVSKLRKRLPWPIINYAGQGYLLEGYQP